MPLAVGVGEGAGAGGGEEDRVGDGFGAGDVGDGVGVGDVGDGVGVGDVGDGVGVRDVGDGVGLGLGDDEGVGDGDVGLGLGDGITDATASAAGQSANVPAAMSPGMISRAARRIPAAADLRQRRLVLEISGLQNDRRACTSSGRTASSRLMQRIYVSGPYQTNESLQAGTTQMELRGG